MPTENKSNKNLPADVNSSQWQAITFEGKHLLIVAGPGTGKTHTLTYRIAQVVQELPYDQKALAITFTNKAAGEMLERLKRRLADDIHLVDVGTFHSFCLQLLRQFIHHTLLPEDFEVATPEQVQDLAKHAWPDKKPRERRALLEKVSQWKSNPAPADLPEEVKVLNLTLRRRKLLDFDDLLWETFQLLQGNKKVMTAIHKTYAYIFVDEYQDINPIQHVLLKMFVGEEGRMTAIGDPNQAIYGFRGSDVRFFEQFPADFPGAVTLFLSDNYRSAPNLLSASGQMIAKAPTQKKVPALTAKIYEEGHLTMHQALTDKAEAEYVVHQIEKMVGGTSMFSRDSGRVDVQQGSERSFGDIAVLYRLNSQSLALQEAFERSGIPYHVAGAPKSGKSDDPVDEICPSRGEELALNVEKVSLMTLHAAKGLEFPVVFIVGVEQNILPLNLEGMVADVDEERRLLYVGMTRAKESLYLLSAHRRRLYGRTFENEPSQFLGDIEEELKSYEKPLERKRKKDSDQMKMF